MKLVPVAGTAAIVWRENDVAALHRLDDERIETRVPIAVDAAVHPHQRGMLRRALLDRRENVRRNLETVRAALVFDFLKLVIAGRLRGIDAIGVSLPRHVALAIVATAANVGG